MADPSRGPLPDLLVLLGDQVYADETSPTVRRLLRAAPAAAEGRPGRPGGELRRVHQALPGVVARPGDPLAALHRAERDDLRRPRDHRRLEHLGVLAGGHARAAVVGRADRAAASPPTGSTSTWATSARTRSPPTRSTRRSTAAEDATERAARVRRSGSTPEADLAHDTERWRAVQYQWSYALDLGRTRLVMLDNRCSRVLEPGRRAMLPPGEWSWFLDQAHGVYDHLVVGTSLPWLLPPGIHHVEAWNETLADSDRPVGGRGWPRSCAGRWTWSTGPRSGAPSTRSAALFARLRQRRRRRAAGAPGRRRSGVRRARPRSACSPATCTTRTWPGPGSPTGGAHPGAPAHLLADPQPGAGRRCVR